MLNDETPSQIDTQLLNNITRLLEIIEGNSSLNFYQFMFDLIFYGLILIMLTIISVNLVVISKKYHNEKSLINERKTYYNNEGGNRTTLIYNDQADILSDVLSDTLSSYP